MPQISSRREQFKLWSIRDETFGGVQHLHHVGPVSGHHCHADTGPTV
jgi:hypothetical protein